MIAHSGTGGGNLRIRGQNPHNRLGGGCIASTSWSVHGHSRAARPAGSGGTQISQKQAPGSQCQRLPGVEGEVVHLSKGSERKSPGVCPEDGNSLGTKNVARAIQQHIGTGGHHSQKADAGGDRGKVGLNQISTRHQSDGGSREAINGSGLVARGSRTKAAHRHGSGTTQINRVGPSVRCYQIKAVRLVQSNGAGGLQRKPSPGRGD